MRSTQGRAWKPAILQWAARDPAQSSLPARLGSRAEDEFLCPDQRSTRQVAREQQPPQQARAKTRHWAAFVLRQATRRQRASCFARGQPFLNQTEQPSIAARVGGHAIDDGGAGKRRSCAEAPVDLVYDNFRALLIADIALVDIKKRLLDEKPLQIYCETRFICSKPEYRPDSAVSVRSCWRYSRRTTATRRYPW